MMIKVCGMRDADNIQAVEQLGIDWMGMIFWPKSSRFVTDVPSYLPKLSATISSISSNCMGRRRLPLPKH